MFDRFKKKNFVLSTFAKNDPLIIQTSGGFLIWGDFLYLGEGIILLAKFAGRRGAPDPLES